MRKAILIVALALLFPLQAFAQDAGAGVIRTGKGATDPACGTTVKIGFGTTCYYRFTGSVNSTVFGVTGTLADICLNTDIASTNDSGAEIQIWRIISDATASGALHPSAEPTATLNHTTGDCFPAPTGSYYIVVSSPPTGETALASLVGRSKQ